MRSRTLVPIVAVLALVASGCGSSSSGSSTSSPAATGASKAKASGDPSKDKLAQMLARGTLVLFTDPKYPPQSFAVKGAKRPARRSARRTR